MRRCHDLICAEVDPFRDAIQLSDLVGEMILQAFARHKLRFLTSLPMHILGCKDSDGKDRSLGTKSLLVGTLTGRGAAIEE